MEIFLNDDSGSKFEGFTIELVENSEASVEQDSESENETSGKLENIILDGYSHPKLVEFSELFVWLFFV